MKCSRLACRDRAQYIAYCWWKGSGPAPEIPTYEIYACGTHIRTWPVDYYLFPFAVRRL